MPKLFWSGKLTFPMVLLVNSNNILAWLIGNSRKTVKMTQRVKLGYDGQFSDHVRRYDELGLKFQIKAAQAQLEEVDIAGRTALDVGCGTGAISFLALEGGGDQSHMRGYFELHAQNRRAESVLPWVWLR